MKSNLEFVPHDPPLVEVPGNGKWFGDIFRCMTITWKGLPLFKVIYSEDSGPCRKARLSDPDDDEDDETLGAQELSSDPKEYLLQAAPDFDTVICYNWGKSSTLEGLKKHALEAEKVITKFAYMMQTRKTQNIGKDSA